MSLESDQYDRSCTHPLPTKDTYILLPVNISRSYQQFHPKKFNAAGSLLHYHFHVIDLIEAKLNAPYI